MEWRQSGSGHRLAPQCEPRGGLRIVKHLFPAINLRFESDLELQNVGRKLFRDFLGDARNVPKPYVEVAGRMESNFDTFDSDIENWALTFRFHGKALRPDDADEFVEAMTGCFDDARWSGSTYRQLETRIEDVVSSVEPDGLFEAEVAVRVIAVRTTRKPYERAM
jgi:hypothetical protein